MLRNSVVGCNNNDIDIEKSFYISEITDGLFSRMYGKSYKENCNVSREELRYLHILHKDLDGNTKQGEIVVNKLISDDV